MQKRYHFDLQFFSDEENDESKPKTGSPKRGKKRKTAGPKKGRSSGASKKKEPEYDFDDDNLIRYVVQEGDTIYRLARKFNTTPRRICELNNLHKPTLLIPGDVIVLPEDL